jgi:hypothetical protein
MRWSERHVERAVVVVRREGEASAHFGASQVDEVISALGPEVAICGMTQPAAGLHGVARAHLESGSHA